MQPEAMDDVNEEVISELQAMARRRSWAESSRLLSPREFYDELKDMCNGRTGARQARRATAQELAVLEEETNTTKGIYDDLKNKCMREKGIEENSTSEVATEEEEPASLEEEADEQSNESQVEVSDLTPKQIYNGLKDMCMRHGALDDLSTSESTTEEEEPEEETDSRYGSQAEVSSIMSSDGPGAGLTPKRVYEDLKDRARDAKLVVDDEDEKLKVVVTGCCDRLGRAVASHLSDQPNLAVHGIDRRPRPDGLASQVVHHQFELSDGAKLSEIISGASAVVHLAGCPDDECLSTALLPSNIVSIAKLLEVCRAAQVGRLVLASSGKVHGAHGGPFPIRLSEMCTPVCNYGATKLFAEGAAQAFATQTGTPTVAIRFAWCPRIMADIEAMKAATRPGNGANEFLSPGDAARCVAAALECSKETLVAALHPPTSAPFAIVFCQSRPLQDGGSRFDMGPTTQLLGFTPRDRFDEGEHGVGELCATDYTDNPEVHPRRWPATPTTAGKGREESEETDESDNEVEVVELKALGDEQALFRPIEPAEL